MQKMDNFDRVLNFYQVLRNYLTAPKVENCNKIQFILGIRRKKARNIVRKMHIQF